MMRKRRLPPDVYSRCITFCYGSVAEINALFRRECPIGFSPLLPSCQGHWKCYLVDGYEADYLCLVRPGSRDLQSRVLAHEALHLAGHALRMAGIPFEEATEEAYAYYQQWIVRECQQALAAWRSR